ncbi:hypothetical protein GIB67_036064 [Kingdonia uniflora]|uniref:TRAF-type domain-containing protein n=1 Tax=Kingdonia uniflora TaxID=39325 RepID=A0A7J7PB65_9MAGN|nr:hypothetical protein GIB67_036064 [Kingdonia uniflora]
MFQCDLFDTEVVHKISEVFLLGLATACVDNTSGDLFKSPATVAVAMRKEMVDYLIQRSETFVTDTTIQEGYADAETSGDPIDIVSDFLDDFANSKQNLFSRVSGWLLSEKREDKIDDFVQEMDTSGFWLTDRRVTVGQAVLKNIDLKNTFHCKAKFETVEDVTTHRNHCIFRSMNCMNESCNVSYCAVHMEKHDSNCPFKVLQCEQKCSKSILRREMDRHCITVCPMKLVNCPFYPLGCRSTIPQCMTEHHLSEFFHSHLLNIFRVIHKEASVEDLERRLEQLKQVRLPYSRIFIV